MSGFVYLSESAPRSQRWLVGDLQRRDLPATQHSVKVRASRCPSLRGLPEGRSSSPPPLISSPRRSTPSSSRGRSAVDAVVPQTEASDVRKVGQAVRVVADRNPVDQLPAAGVHHGDGAVVTVGVPELCSIGRELEHVGTPADLPRGGYLAGRQVYH